MIEELLRDLILGDVQAPRPTDHPEAIVVGLSGNPLVKIPDGMEASVGRIGQGEVPVPGIVFRIFSRVDPSRQTVGERGLL